MQGRSHVVTNPDTTTPRAYRNSGPEQRDDRCKDSRLLRRTTSLANDNQMIERKPHYTS